MAESKLVKHGFKFVNFPGGEEAAEHFGISHCVIVPPSTRTVIVGGQLGIKPDGTVPTDLEEEVVEAFTHVELALKAAGLGDDAWEYVYDVKTFETAGDNGVSVASVAVPVARRFLKTTYPTWTGVEISKLAVPGVHIEITVKAFLPN